MPSPTQAPPQTSSQWQPSARYPDPSIEALDPAFKKHHLALSAVERLWTGSRWGEGPVWLGDVRCLLWSDIPNNRVLKWEEETGAVSIWRKPSNNANGHTRDRQGRIIACEHEGRRVVRFEYDGSITVLADSYQGKRLNSPNDVVVKSDGSIWFTDPPFGTYAFYVSAGLTLFFFLACLLKAKQLEVSRLGGAIDGHSVLAVSPTPGTEPLAPAGVVPPPVPGVAGVFTGAASAAEHLAGVTARTTVPNPGAVPADAAPAAPPPPMPQSGLSIGDANARYALAANQAIDFSTLFGGVPAGCQGTIVAAGDGGLDIRNTGAAAWAWTTPDGATASVPPGGSIRPVAGGKLLLGPATIAVSAY